MIKILLVVSMANAFWDYRSFRECADAVAKIHKKESLKVRYEKISRECAKYVRTLEDECQVSMIFYPELSHLYCVSSGQMPQCDGHNCH